MAPEGVFAEKDRGQVHGRWPEVADNLGGWSLDATEPTDEAGRDVFAYMVFEKGLHGANCCTGDRMDKSCVQMRSFRDWQRKFGRDCIRAHAGLSYRRYAARGFLSRTRAGYVALKVEIERTDAELNGGSKKRSR